MMPVWKKEITRNHFRRQYIQRTVEYLNNGLIWVIDLDLAKFFDTINHGKLLQVLSKHVQDRRVISLIRKFLQAPVCENGTVGPKTKIGTPQGGCVNPVLANILLNVEVRRQPKGSYIE